MKIKVGIIFGGHSRQRVKSFHGATFLYFHLPAYSVDKVLIWIDKEGKYFSVNDSCFLQGDLEKNISSEIDPKTLGQQIHIALATLASDDNQMAFLFETLQQLNIPNNLHTLSRKYALNLENWWHDLKMFNFRSPSSRKCTVSEWDQTTTEVFSAELKRDLGGGIQIIPMPYSAKNAGSFLMSDTKEDMIQERMNRSFFRDWISKVDWQTRSDYEKTAWVNWLSDPLEGPDFPLYLVAKNIEKTLINSPQDLPERIDHIFAGSESDEFIIGIEPFLENTCVQLVSIPNGIPFQSMIWYHEGTWHCLPPFSSNELLTGKPNIEYFTALQSAGISAQMIQIGQSFQFNSPQVISGFVTTSGKCYSIEIQPFLEIADEKKWFEHLGMIDLTPTSFLDIILHQIIGFQAFSEGIAGKIALQLMNILTEKKNESPFVFPNSIILDSTGNIDISLLAEALSWYEKLAVSSSLDAPIIVSENNSLGQLFHVVPARWLYLAIQHKAEQDVFFEKIRKHCPKTDVRKLKENGHVMIPITCGKEAAQGHLFQCFESEKIPYWGPGSSLAGVFYKKSTQMQTLERNGFKTLPSRQLSNWLKEGFSNDGYYRLSANEYNYDEKHLVLQGEHEINAFRQFLTDSPRPTETQRNRKYWKHFFEEIQETDRLQTFIQEQKNKDEIIFSFFYSKNANEIFKRRFLTPVHVVISEDQQIDYLFTSTESKLIEKLISCGESLTEQLENALQVLNFSSPGYIRCHIDLFEDLSFHITFKEINPLFSVRKEWIEKQLINNNISWNSIIAEQNEYATFKIPTENELEEEEDINSFEENKLPFHHVNSDIVIENAVVWEEKPDEEREKRINEAMNNLTPTRFSKNVNDYLTEIWLFLKSWFFIKNILALVLGIFVMVNLVKGVLFLYTRHGSGKVVMDYAGMRFETATEKASDQGFNLVASDEVYVLNRPAGIIISQVPEKGSKIKSGRTIYCVVTGGDAPAVTLPKLSNNDEYEAYQKQLIRLGIYSRIREERFEAEYEEKTILEVYFEGRKLSNSRINASQVKIPKGSYLDFVISVRNTDRTPVPDLVCNTYEEAVTNITANDLIVGSVIGPQSNESFSGMYVIKQEPAAGEGVFLPKGSAVILYLQKEKPDQCPEF